MYRRLSKGMNVDLDSKHTHVLLAISQGANTVGKISNATGLDKQDVESILLSLKIAGLIDSSEVKGFLRRKTVYYLTERGKDELRAIKERLSEMGRNIEDVLRRGSREEIERTVKEYEDWLPIMMMWGIIDSMLLLNTLSMLGLMFDDLGYYLDDFQEDTWEI